MRSRFTSSCLAALFMGLTVLPAAAEDISGYTGEQAFRRFCASCHGPLGQGDGLVAGMLKSEVPDLTALARRRGGRFPRDLVRRVIDGTEIRAPHGSREMPVWGREFREAQGGDEKAREETKVLVDRLVEFLASIQK